MKNHLTNLLLGIAVFLLAVDVAARLGSVPAKGPEDRIADALDKIANNGIKLDGNSELAIKGTFHPYPPVSIKAVK